MLQLLYGRKECLKIGNVCVSATREISVCQRYELIYRIIVILGFDFMCLI